MSSRNELNAPDGYGPWESSSSSSDPSLPQISLLPNSNRAPRFYSVLDQNNIYHYPVPASRVITTENEGNPDIGPWNNHRVSNINITEENVLNIGESDELSVGSTPEVDDNEESIQHLAQQVHDLSVQVSNLQDIMPSLGTEYVEPPLHPTMSSHRYPGLFSDDPGIGLGLSINPSNHRDFTPSFTDTSMLHVHYPSELEYESGILFHDFPGYPRVDVLTTASFSRTSSQLVLSHQESAPFFANQRPIYRTQADSRPLPIGFIACSTLLSFLDANGTECPSMTVEDDETRNRALLNDDLGVLQETCDSHSNPCFKVKCLPAYRVGR